MEQRSVRQGGCRWLREGGRHFQAEDRVRVKTQKWMGQGVLEEPEEASGNAGWRLGVRGGYLGGTEDAGPFRLC